jgi:hypothetical protein
MQRRRVLGLVLSLSLVATAAGLVGASAASLNGAATARIGGWTYPATNVAPTVLTWASFTGANNTNLDGATLNGGGTWSADIGTWRIQSNAANAGNTALANLVTNVGTQNATVVATLVTGATSNAGVIANDNGTNALFVLYTKAAGGTLTLYKYAGSSVSLSSVTGVGTAANSTLKLDSTTTTIKVSWNGTQVISYTLNPAEVVTFHSAANSRFGLIANGDSASRFDDFHVDQ